MRTVTKRVNNPGKIETVLFFWCFLFNVIFIVVIFQSLGQSLEGFRLPNRNIYSMSWLVVNSESVIHQYLDIVCTKNLRILRPCHNSTTCMMGDARKCDV